MADTNENRLQEHAYLPPAVPNHNHGHTVAAWTTTIAVLLGILVAAGAMIAAQVWLVLVGVSIAVLGAVAGRVLAALGYGQPPVTR